MQACPPGPLPAGIKRSVSWRDNFSPGYAPVLFFFVRAALRTIFTDVTPTVNSAQAPLRHTEGSA